MPVAPRKICRYPGCSTLTETAYCGQHEKKKQDTVKSKRIKYDKERGTATQRGYNYSWSKYSKQFRKENPLCVMCEKEGIVTLADCVDHIVPVSGQEDPLFWQASNHQSLCHSCHSVKTAKEDGGYGNDVKLRF